MNGSTTLALAFAISLAAPIAAYATEERATPFNARDEVLGAKKAQPTSRRHQGLIHEKPPGRLVAVT